MKEKQRWTSNGRKKKNGARSEPPETNRCDEQGAGEGKSEERSSDRAEKRPSPIRSGARGLRPSQINKEGLRGRPPSCPARAAAAAARAAAGRVGSACRSAESHQTTPVSRDRPASRQGRPLRGRGSPYFDADHDPLLRVSRPPSYDDYVDEEPRVIIQRDVRVEEALKKQAKEYKAKCRRERDEAVAIISARADGETRKAKVAHEKCVGLERDVSRSLERIARLELVVSEKTALVGEPTDWLGQRAGPRPRRSSKLHVTSIGDDISGIKPARRSGRRLTRPVTGCRPRRCSPTAAAAERRYNGGRRSNNDAAVVPGESTRLEEASSWRGGGVFLAFRLVLSVAAHGRFSVSYSHSHVHAVFVKPERSRRGGWGG